VQSVAIRIVSGVVASSLVSALTIIAVASDKGTAVHRATLAAQASVSTINLDNCPILHTGYRGGCVSQLQTDLNSLPDYHVDADGIFGSQTYDAVTAFQRSKGLDSDGIVGPGTKEALDATLAALSVPTPELSAAATSVPYPPLNWLAGTSNSPYAQIQLISTDPINVVLHDPSGHASDLVEQALAASGHWFSNTCYNRSVVLPVTDLNAAYNVTDFPPVTSFTTDVSGSGDVDFMHGCGSLGIVRGHMRLWRSQDNETVWIAGSEEIPTGSWTSPHRLADNAFNAGRDQLASDLASGLLASGHRYGACQCVSYSPAVPSYPAGSLQGVAYDGNVALFDLGNG
jgi:peptidoglycan hydrolase-like protein with peptidoglycan-binding domain